jgi:hypothetical protein
LRASRRTATSETEPALPEIFLANRLRPA